MMSQESEHNTSVAESTERTESDQKNADEQVFLVIVDESEELERTLYYACRRVKRSAGRVALLYCDLNTTNQDFMQFLGIGQRLEEESRQQAEELMQNLSEKAYRWTGKMPIILIEQDIQEALPRLVREEKISIIIQPMPREESSSKSWAAYLLEGGAEQLHIPVTMVPSTITIEEINRLT